MEYNFKETQENWKNGSKNSWESIISVYIGFCVVIISVLLIFKVFVAPNVKMPEFFDSKTAIKNNNIKIDKNAQNISDKRNIPEAENKDSQEITKTVNSNATNFNDYVPSKAEIRQQEKQAKKIQKEELKEQKKQQKIQQKQLKKEAKELKKAEKKKLKEAKKAVRSNDNDDLDNNLYTEDD